MKKHKKIFQTILAALFGFLVSIYTKGSYLGLIIIASTFLVIYLAKMFILKEQKN